ncbi:hypothetical protein JCM10212_001254 [Sporobolomyces blumeae]
MDRPSSRLQVLSDSAASSGGRLFRRVSRAVSKHAHPPGDASAAPSGSLSIAQRSVSPSPSSPSSPTLALPPLSPPLSDASTPPLSPSSPFRPSSSASIRSGRRKPVPYLDLPTLDESLMSDSSTESSLSESGTSDDGRDGQRSQRSVVPTVVDGLWSSTVDERFDDPWQAWEGWSTKSSPELYASSRFSPTPLSHRARLVDLGHSLTTQLVEAGLKTKPSRRVTRPSEAPRLELQWLPTLPLDSYSPLIDDTSFLDGDDDKDVAFVAAPPAVSSVTLSTRRCRPSTPALLTSDRNMYDDDDDDEILHIRMPRHIVLSP